MVLPSLEARLESDGTWLVPLLPTAEGHYRRCPRASPLRTWALRPYLALRASFLSCLDRLSRWPGYAFGRGDSWFASAGELLPDSTVQLTTRASRRR